jgi:hypothetical protein
LFLIPFSNKRNQNPWRYAESRAGAGAPCNATHTEVLQNERIILICNRDKEANQKVPSGQNWDNLSNQIIHVIITQRIKYPFISV